MSKTLRTVDDVIDSIAGDIERYGHWQSGRHADQALNSSRNPAGLCCLLINPTAFAMPELTNPDLWPDTVEEMKRRLGVRWLASTSDTMPTGEILAKLRVPR